MISPRLTLSVAVLAAAVLVPSATAAGAAPGPRAARCHQPVGAKTLKRVGKCTVKHVKRAKPKSVVQPLTRFADSPAATRPAPALGALPASPLLQSLAAVVTVPAVSVFESYAAVLTSKADPTAGGAEYQALTSMGVPVVVTGDPTAALKARVVIVGVGAETVVDQAALSAYVTAGGTLILQAPTSAPLLLLAGLTNPLVSTTRTTLTFAGGDDDPEDDNSPAPAFPELDDLNRTAEREIALDDGIAGSQISTVGYTTVGASTLASYDAKNAAVTASHTLTGGSVYVFGATFLDLIERHFEGARLAPRRGYVNQGGSDASSVMLVLRSIYRISVPGGVTLSTAPETSTSAVIPTISANWSTAFDDALVYVNGVRGVGAQPTVFLPTKYSSDWLDAGFFTTDAAAPFTKSLAAMRDGESVFTPQPEPLASPGATSTEPVSPVFECWDQNPTGGYRLWFGYLGRMYGPGKLLPLGATNVFTPATANGRQPTQFAGGRHVKEFYVPVTTTANVVWTLDGRTATGNSASSTQLCSTRTAGAELASHAVSHTPQFDKIPLGSGVEAYSATPGKGYEPFVGGNTPDPGPTANITKRTSTKNATLLGELRVSKSLLESGPQSPIVSFRAPYLLVRPDLAASEDAVGYRYDSSTTQGWVQTSFPFHPPSFDGTRWANVTTFPIVVSDLNGTKEFIDREAESIELTRNNSQNGAPSVFLVHPNANALKKQAYPEVLRRIRESDSAWGGSTWFGSLDRFGRFWSQRESINVASKPHSVVCAGGVDFTVSRWRGTSDTSRDPRQALDVAAAFTKVVWAGGATQAFKRKLALPNLATIGDSVTGTLCP